MSGSTSERFSQLYAAESELAHDKEVLEAAEKLKLTIVEATLDQCLLATKDSNDCLFLLKHFTGEIFDKLKSAGVPIVGRPALLSCAIEAGVDHTDSNSRAGGRRRFETMFHPLYCTSMHSVALCFTGFRKRNQLKRLVDLVHYMGGSVRREVGMNVTHVVANCSSGEKYRYAVTFNIPVLQYSWIESLWERRDVDCSATTTEAMTPHRIRPFCGARVLFVGFSDEESEHMRELLVSNGGAVCLNHHNSQHQRGVRGHCHEAEQPTGAEEDVDALDCASTSTAESATDSPTHIVVDDSNCSEPSVAATCTSASSRAHVVRAEWFWASIQMDAAMDEALYPFKSKQIQEPGSPGGLRVPVSVTPKSRSLRKRKRLRATVQQLALSPSGASHSPQSVGNNNYRYSGAKRRSSVHDVNQLSTSGSFLDKTTDNADDSAFTGPQLVPCPSDFNIRLSCVFENPTSPHTPLTSSSDRVDSPAVQSTPCGTGTISALSASGAVCPDHGKSLSPRLQVFNELLQTETNYVAVLNTIVNLFKHPLEKNDHMGGPLLEAQDIKTIFGNIPPILEVHSRMREDFERMSANWNDELSIGQVIMRHSEQLMQAYPSFINYFERSKETLAKLDQTQPRFHAFLKINQSKQECGRQTLQELLIRPVQRLPSIILLLNDLLKHTPKSLADHQALNEAVARIKEVMTHINEDKRRTEAQMALFNIFNDIENCPPHLVSSHRTYVTRCEVIEIKGDVLSGRGDHLSLFVFSDILEVCKRRARYNSLRSPSTVSLAAAASARSSKPHKHVVLIPLAHIKRVVDIRETDECHKVFTLICRSNQELKERHYTFTISSEDVNKDQFLRTLCRQMAHVTCRADSENFLTQVDPQCLEIDSSDVSMNSTLSRVSRFASRTSRKVGRAFSFKQTPNKLRRAVSTVISPFQTSSASSVGGTSSASGCTPLAAAASTLNLMEVNASTPLSSGFSGSSTMPHPRMMTPRSSKKFKTGSLGVSSARLQ